MGRGRGREGSGARYRREPSPRNWYWTLRPGGSRSRGPHRGLAPAAPEGPGAVAELGHGRRQGPGELA